jgi:hypothetical protein
MESSEKGPESTFVRKKYTMTHGESDSVPTSIVFGSDQVTPPSSLTE